MELASANISGYKIIGLMREGTLDSMQQIRELYQKQREARIEEMKTYASQQEQGTTTEPEPDSSSQA